jgi:predicted Rdx family selenoprotein
MQKRRQEQKRLIDMEALLNLFKIDMGITHNLRDAFFIQLIKSSIQEIERRGITLDKTKADDQILIVDYAVWTYRKRQEDIPLANNIQHRLRNRIIKERAIGTSLTLPPEEPEENIIEIIDIQGLQDALNLKADDSDLFLKANNADVYNKFEAYNKTEIDILNENKADINHNHDTDYAAIVHNHDADYAPIVHDHDADYAAIVHNHDADYAAINHNHDTDYAAIVHNHDADYAPIVHNHDTEYAPIVHNHDTEYAPIVHNHDTEYAPIVHNHDTEYAPLILPNEIVLNVTNLTNSVQLDWEIGTATSWTIWRSEVNGKLGEKLIDSLVTNTYLDTTVLGGTTYYYTLQIEDVSEKTISDQVQAIPYSITVYGNKRVDFAGYAGWTVYTTTEATADFGNEFTVQGGERLKIDTSERLRFELPIGMVGSADTGGIIKAKIAGKTDYTIEYGIRFDSGFPWSKGGKVPGFSGGAGYTGGAPAWDGDGFSVRLMWREGGRIIPYVYHYNQPDEFGDTFGETLGYFTDTQEHIVKYYAVLNTGANPDGILKIYLDGVQVFDKRDLVYRTDESLIDTAHLAIFAGGSGADWNMTGTGYIRLNYYDWG